MENEGQTLLARGLTAFSIPVIRAIRGYKLPQSHMKIE